MHLPNAAIHFGNYNFHIAPLSVQSAARLLAGYRLTSTDCSPPMRFAVRATLCTVSLLMSAISADVNAKVTATQTPPPDGVAVWREQPSPVQFPTGKKCQTSLLPPPRFCA